MDSNKKSRRQNQEYFVFMDLCVMLAHEDSMTILLSRGLKTNYFLQDYLYIFAQVIDYFLSKNISGHFT